MDEKLADDSGETPEGAWENKITDKNDERFCSQLRNGFCQEGRIKDVINR
jgi:hypothetical protein